MKVLVPILEGAGLEDSDYLIEKWAGLLASAASGGEVLPAWAKILSELSPDEAKILDHLADYGKHLEYLVGNVFALDLKSIRSYSHLSLHEFSIRMLNLERLGAIELITTGGHTPGQRYFNDSDLDNVALTRLGISLVEACRGPRKQIAEISPFNP